MTMTLQISAVRKNNCGGTGATSRVGEAKIFFFRTIHCTKDVKELRDVKRSYGLRMAQSLAVASPQTVKQILSVPTILTMPGVTGAAGYGCFPQLQLLISSSNSTLEQYAEPDRAHRLAKFHLAIALQKNCRVHAFFGLRIPDAHEKVQTEIDLVVFTKWKLYVVEIIYWDGRINLEVDGSWQQTLVDGMTIKHPNIIEETQRRASLLQLYLSQRGLTLPSSFFEYKVLLASSNLRVDKAILSQREVLLIEDWESLLAKESKRSMLERMKLIMPEEKKNVLTKHLREQLYFILSTAPTWDRVVLNGGSIVFGDFLEFKGVPEDLEGMKLIKRSHVSHLKVTYQQKYTPGHFMKKTVSEVEVSCTPRDFRVNALKRAKKGQIESTLQQKIRPDMEIVFKAIGAPRAHHFKVKNVLSMHLTA